MKVKKNCNELSVCACQERGMITRWEKKNIIHSKQANL